MKNSNNIEPQLIPLKEWKKSWQNLKEWFYKFKEIIKLFVKII